MDLIKDGHFYYLENNDSEEIASYVHYFLSVTPYDVKKKEENEE